MTGDWLGELLFVVSYSAAWFCVGVSWAAYRAVSWVERMRSWAYSTQLDELEAGGAAGGPGGVRRDPATSHAPANVPNDSLTTHAPGGSS